MDGGSIVGESADRADVEGDARELLREETLGEIFAETARRHAERVAVECGAGTGAAAGTASAGVRWTYAELAGWANQLARWLRGRGVGRGDFVGLWMGRGGRGADAYVGMLGILMSGAAYVPIDPEYPVERVEDILRDAGAKGLVTESGLAGKLGSVEKLASEHAGSERTLARAVANSGREGAVERVKRSDGGLEWVAKLDEMGAELERLDAGPLTRAETGVASGDVAYMIYTSGSTGRPKGVPITHRSACHLVRAEGRIFGVGSEDRVFQGFSLAFDASVEEVWLAFFAGAALVPGSAEVVRSGAKLAAALREARVTVLSCVPTLLALVEEDVPTVRLLILGGEACPAELVRRWWRAADGAGAASGRRVVNTYGPTEATVIATYADCVAGEAVTIGRALPNYRAYVVGEDGALVADGAAGELCLSGVGLSSGYWRRPELTAEKFVVNRFSTEAGFERLYRTGDLVRVNSSGGVGDIEFLGRIDSQVKLRGFRIELGEIETAIRESCAEVLNAVVVLREDVPGMKRLVGYVVVRDGGGAFDERVVKEALRGRLPAYMVPACIERLEAMPVLASGKADRKRLPVPAQRAVEVDDPPRGELEEMIAATWCKCEGMADGAASGGAVSRGADFFMELGGDSLLVAVFVSRLRAEAQTADVDVRDVYAHASVAKLAAAVGARRASADVPAAVEMPRRAAVGRVRHGLFSLAQTILLYVVIGFYSLQWITPYLVYIWMNEMGEDRVTALAWALGALLGVYPLMLAATVVAKWVLVGRLKPGRHKLWGFFHLRWWLTHRILDAVAVEYLEGTPLMNGYFRLMGARIGKRVHFRSYNIGAFDLVSVGDDTCLGDGTALLGFAMEEGELRLAPVTVGARCHVGAGSVLRPGAVMEDDARLMHMSLLADGARVPSGQTWFGAPARRHEGAREVMPAAPAAGFVKRAVLGGMQAAGIFLLPVTYLAALFPGLVLLNEVAAEYGNWWSLAVAPVVALSFVVLLCMEMLIIKWLLVGRVKAGNYPVASGFFVRKWFVDQLMGLSLDILGPMYATLYLNPWYRLMGAKMGRRTEISTACAASPDLLEIGAESFIADAVMLGVPEVENGMLALKQTRIGRRAFVGNSALVPAGVTLADSTLIGVLSTPPLEKPGAEEADTTWLGSPAFRLPRRQVNAQFSEEATYNPPARLVLVRLMIEAARILLPLTLFVVLTTLLINTCVALEPYIEDWALVLMFPCFYVVAGLGAVVFTIAAKWLVVGRYKPCVRPLWSTFVWRSELINSLHENLAGAYLVDMLDGTPWLAWYLRLMGMKIGKRPCLESAEFTEFDLVTIGDDVTINMEATVQTHLFEDRVMKMSKVEIGDRCTIGACAVVLYDTRIGDDAVLEDLSLVMKGEQLPAGTRWHGSPAQRVQGRK